MLSLANSRLHLRVMLETSQVPSMSFADKLCIKYCVYNYDEDFCEGCGRNLDEITDWSKYSQQKKAEIADTSRKRLEESNVDRKHILNNRKNKNRK